MIVPDNTDRVVERLISLAPNNIKIKYFSHKNNLGIMPNFDFAVGQTNSKYYALCEGDDYWTDPKKLQKQIDF
jgi:glycosyltransferase involved in cell wall biosynthesis